MASHTQDKWITSKDGHYVETEEREIFDVPEHICKVYYREDGKDNAKLIAAAPELREALIEAHIFIGALDYSTVGCPPDLWKKMKSAISNAETE